MQGVAWLGLRVEVWWDGEEEWFGGNIVKYENKTKKHMIEYDDNDVIVEDLRKSRVRWPANSKPTAEPTDGKPSAEVDAVAGDGGSRVARDLTTSSPTMSSMYFSSKSPSSRSSAAKTTSSVWVGGLTHC